MLLRPEPVKPTLILSIAPLYFLMYPFLNLPFQYTRSSWFIIVCHFQDMRCVNPVILAAAHDMILFNIEFVHRNLGIEVSAVTKGPKIFRG